MVSKNTIALFLTINLVLFGFTVAQSPTCPRDTKACTEAYINSLMFLDIRGLLPCCTLLGCYNASVATACICKAVKAAVTMTTNITTGIGYVRRVCKNPSLPDNITCA